MIGSGVVLFENWMMNNGCRHVLCGKRVRSRTVREGNPEEPSLTVRPLIPQCGAYLTLRPISIPHIRRSSIEEFLRQITIKSLQNCVFRLRQASETVGVVSIDRKGQHRFKRLPAYHQSIHRGHELIVAVRLTAAGRHPIQCPVRPRNETVEACRNEYRCLHITNEDSSF